MRMMNNFTEEQQSRIIHLHWVSSCNNRIQFPTIPSDSNDFVMSSQPLLFLISLYVSLLRYRNNCNIIIRYFGRFVIYDLSVILLRKILHLV